MNERIEPLPLSPEFGPGDTVVYRGDPENRWVVIGIRPATGSNVGFWVMAEQGGTRQNFPYAVFTRVDKKQRKAPAPNVVKTEPVAKKQPRKDSIGDPVAKLLAEATDIAACWRIAELAGLPIDETRGKIGHLSNGLQRMGLGNRLRKMWKDGQFDPESIVCIGTGRAEDFAYRADHPEFEESAE